MFLEVIETEWKTMGCKSVASELTGKARIV